MSSKQKYARDVTERSLTKMLVQTYATVRPVGESGCYPLPSVREKKRAPSAGNTIRTKLSIPSIAILASQAARLRGNRVI